MTRINLSKIVAIVAPIVVPVIVGAVSGALAKQGDKLIAKATKPKVVP